MISLSGFLEFKLNDANDSEIDPLLPNFAGQYLQLILRGHIAKLWEGFWEKLLWKNRNEGYLTDSFYITHKSLKKFFCNHYLCYSIYKKLYAYT